MKKFLIALSIIIILSSLTYSSVLAYEMYKKYNDTIEWENSSLLDKIDKVPPSLAQNYISIEEQKLYAILTDVNIALEEMIENGEIPDDKYDEYWELHDKAKKEIKNNDKYEELSVKSIFNDFDLYLKADKTIRNAYDDLQIDKLEEYTKTFSNRLSKEELEIETSFLNDLKEISNDYKTLNQFSNKAIEKLGSIKDNVLNVAVKVDKDITNELLKDIKDNKLKRFAHIDELAKTLNSNSWKDILSHNISTQKYYSWKESEKILKALSASDYIAISSFKTVDDVLDYSPNIQMSEKEHHSIDKDSKVKKVFYDGKELDDDLYIKRSASLNFAIDYEYIEDPKSTIDVEYLNKDGDEISDEVSHTNYVGSGIDVHVKDIDGYVFDEIKNNLNKFPKKDSTIQVIYEKYVPPEPEPEEDDSDDSNNNSDDSNNEDNSDDSNNDENKNSESDENKDNRENDENNENADNESNDDDNTNKDEEDSQGDQNQQENNDDEEQDESNDEQKEEDN